MARMMVLLNYPCLSSALLTSRKEVVVLFVGFGCTCNGQQVCVPTLSLGSPEETLPAAFDAASLQLYHDRLGGALNEWANCARVYQTRAVTRFHVVACVRMVSL